MKILDYLFKPKDYNQPLEISNSHHSMQLNSFRNVREDHKYRIKDYTKHCLSYTFLDINHTTYYNYYFHAPTSLELNRHFTKVLNMLNKKVTSGVHFNLSIILKGDKMYQEVVGEVLLEVEIDYIKNTRPYILNQIALNSVNSIHLIYGIYDEKNRYQLAIDFFNISKRLWETNNYVTAKQIYGEFIRENRKKVIPILDNKKNKKFENKDT